MDVHAYPPKSVMLLDERCEVDWGATTGIWLTGAVLVNGRPLARLEWHAGKLQQPSVERAAKALRSYRASAGRFSILDRREASHQGPLDAARLMSKPSARSSLTWHRHAGIDYWCLEPGTVDACFSLWDEQLAEDAAQRVSDAGGDLDLAGRLKPASPAFRARQGVSRNLGQRA